MTSTAVAEKSANQPVILQYLEKYKNQIALALPKHLDPDRMARIVTTEVRKNRDLLQCNPTSLFGAVIQCSQLGLEPGNALGHAYLIPFNNRGAKTKDVQLIIGYRGMIDLARRSGQIVSIIARVVREGDEFDYSYGLGDDVLDHKPIEPDPAAKPGDITHVYAVARLKDGGIQHEVMNRFEINQVRKRSKSADRGPWVTDFAEMAKKTVIRRLFKYLPVSIEIQRAVGLDELGETEAGQQNSAILDGEFHTLPDDNPAEPESTIEALKQRLAPEDEDQSQEQEPQADITPEIIFTGMSKAPDEERVQYWKDMADDHLEEKDHAKAMELASVRIGELRAAG